MKSGSFSVKARGKSFKYAFRGIRQFFLQEPNAVIHLAFSIIVFCGMICFDLSKSEMLALLLAIAFVWVAEIFNTAIEKMADLICPEKDSRVAFIKDVSAGAVLLAAITAAVVGAIVFIPKII